MVTVRAIYENGILRLLDDIDLEEGQEVDLLIQNKVINKQVESQDIRIPDLHLGAFIFGADFDEPLPDSFWSGEDE